MRLATLLLSLLSLGFSGVALADLTHPAIFSYGNGEMLYWIMAAMTDAISNPAMRQIIFFFLLVLFIFVVASSFQGGRLKIDNFIMWILGVTFMYTVVLNPNVSMDITIADLYNTEYSTTRDVEDVPVFIAFPAVVTSEMSRLMTRMVEEQFASFLPESLRMSEQGRFNLGAQIVQDMGKIRFTDPQVVASLNVFMKDCIIPELYEGNKQISKLLTSPNILADLEPTNHGRLTIYYGSEKRFDGNPYADNVRIPGTATNYPEEEADATKGVMTGCHASWASQVARFESFGPALVRNLDGSMLYQSDILDTAISSVSIWAMGDGPGRGTDGTGSDIFMRSAVGNMFRDSASDVAAIGGNDNILNRLSIAEAKANQRAGWIVAAEVFSNMFGYLFAVIQSFFFAIAPFVLVLFVMPKIGGKAVFSFFGMLIWLALWEPFMALVHVLSLFWMKSLLMKGGIADGHTILSTYLAPGSLPYISEAGANIRAATDFLATMVPMLTYGLVKGGEFAFTNFVKDAAAPSASNKAAGNIVSDSFSYGAKSLNNISANKHMFDDVVAGGVGGVTQHQSAGSMTLKQDAGGYVGSAYGQQVYQKQEEGAASTAAISSEVAKSIQQNFGGSVTAQQAQAAGRDIASSTGESYARSQAAVQQRLQAVSQALSVHSDNARKLNAGASQERDQSTITSSSVRASANGWAALAGGLGSIGIGLIGGKDPMSASQQDWSLALDAQAKHEGGMPALANKMLGEQRFGAGQDKEAKEALMLAVQSRKMAEQVDPNASEAQKLETASWIATFASSPAEAWQGIIDKVSHNETAQRVFKAFDEGNAAEKFAIAGAGLAGATAVGVATVMGGAAIGAVGSATLAAGKSVAVAGAGGLARAGTGIVSALKKSQGTVDAAGNVIAAGKAGGGGKGPFEVTAGVEGLNRENIGFEVNAGTDASAGRGSRSTNDASELSSFAASTTANLNNVRDYVERDTSSFSNGSVVNYTLGITESDAANYRAIATEQASLNTTGTTGVFGSAAQLSRVVATGNSGAMEATLDRARGQREDVFAKAGDPNATEFSPPPRDNPMLADRNRRPLEARVDEAPSTGAILGAASGTPERPNLQGSFNEGAQGVRADADVSAIPAQKAALVEQAANYAQIARGRVAAGDQEASLVLGALQDASDFGNGLGVESLRAVHGVQMMESDFKAIQQSTVALTPREGGEGIRDYNFTGSQTLFARGDGEVLMAPEVQGVANNGANFNGVVLGGGAKNKEGEDQSGRILVTSNDGMMGMSDAQMKQLVQEQSFYEPSNFPTPGSPRYESYTVDDYIKDVQTDLAGNDAALQSILGSNFRQ